MFNKRQMNSSLPESVFGFEALMQITVKSTVFWGMTQCSQIDVNRRFGGKYYFRLRGRRLNYARNKARIWQHAGHFTFSKIYHTTRRHTPEYRIFHPAKKKNMKILKFSSF
jgi:hypothetical protein